MRKIILLALFVFGLGFYLLTTKATKYIDLKLNDEIGIVFVNKSMILVLGDKKSSLLVLNDNESIENLSKFKYDNLDVLMLSDNNININYDNKIIIDKKYTLGNVDYKMDDGLLYITSLNTNTCIYMGEAENISDCDFVYFYDTDVKNLPLSNYQELFFYYYKNPLSNRFLERANEKLIDIYQIRDDEIAVIKIGEEDYDFIVIPNN